MSIAPAVAHHRARAAALTRSRDESDPDLIDAKQSLRAARLEDVIRRSVDAAPPLTTEQRERLATLLRPSPTAGGGPNAA